MSREEYSSAILSSVKPDQAAELMKERLSRAQALNEELADWVRERARIEEHYASELDKLYKKPVPPASGTMGTLVPAWKNILKTLQDNVNESTQFAHKLHSNVEVPLRRFGRSNQVQDIKGLQEGLVQLAHTLGRSEDHHHKLTTGKKKSREEIEQAQIEVAENQSQWENQGPFAFEQFEALDHSRLVLLKDVLTRLESMEVDRHQAGITSSETAMNSVLSWDPNEEIKTFAAHVVSGEAHVMGITGPKQQQPSTPQTTGPRRSTSASTHDELYERPSAGRLNHNSIINNDDVSVHSGTKEAGEKRAKLRSKVGSIFRGKKKEQKHHSPPIEGIKEEPSTWPAAQLQHSHTSPALSESAPAPPPHRQSTMPPPPPPPSRKTNGSTAPSAVSYRDNELPPVPQNAQPQQQQQQAPPPPPPPPASQNQVDSEGFTVPKASGVGFDRVHEEQEEENDDEGHPFKVNIRQSTIAEEGDDDNTALSTVASKLRARPTVSGRANRGRRDIQSKLFSNIEASDVEQQRQQEESSPTTARPPQQFLNQLQSFPTGGSATQTSPPISPATQQPPAQPQPQPQAQAQAPAPAPAPVEPQPQAPVQPQPQAPTQVHQVDTSTPSLASDQTPSRSGSQGDVLAQAPPGHHSETQSLKSMHSTSSVPAAAGGIKHPEIGTGAGLNATNVELVSAQLQDGHPVKVTALGEVALGYNGVPPQDMTVKLENAGAVDRFLPVQNVLQAKENATHQYKLKAPSTITGVKSGVVAFKYLVKSAQVPVVFTPVWRLEDHQASLMLSYKLHESVTEPVTFEDLVVSVPVQGGEALSAQSKPTASFNRETQRCTWRFTQPVTLSPGAEEQLLCRFMTNGQVKEGKSGIDIKFRVTGISSKLKVLYSLNDAPPSSDPFGDTENPANGSLDDSHEWHETNMALTVVTNRYSSTSEKNVNVM